MKTNKELVLEARTNLSGIWTKVVVFSLIYYSVTQVIYIITILILMIILSIPLLAPFAHIINLLIAFMITPLLYVGFYRYFLDIKAGGVTGDYDVLFRWFKKGFLRIVLTYFVVCVYILLWTCLLIVPGIIKSIAYAQTFFILAEDDMITPSSAIRKSQNMMRGYKMQYFLLNLRFIGWTLLSILTLGVGFIWLIPYMMTAFAGFYNELKKNYTEEDSSCCC